MKLISFIFFFYIIIFTSNAFSQNIAVINLNKIIDNNNSYNKILKDIELNQEKYLKNFEIKENDLKIQLKEIEDTKLILSEVEINLRIDNYNNQLSEFTILIDKFNVHYQNQIIYIRENILKEIIKLLEKYAVENNVDLILDSGSYLISSTSLDITSDINSEIEKLSLNLEFKDFEKD